MCNSIPDLKSHFHVHAHARSLSLSLLTHAPKHTWMLRYDNKDHAHAAEETYDNKDHAAATSAADVDALVQAQVDAKLRDMEQSIRMQVEREMREKAEADAQAKAKAGATTSEENSLGHMHNPIYQSGEPDKDDLGHQPNPIYQSFDAPTRSPPAAAAESDTNAKEKSPDKKKASSLFSWGKHKKDLPKPRSSKE